MSSDPFVFATLGEQLEEYLRPLVPEKWRIQDAAAPLGKTSGVVLTYAQGNASTKIDGSVAGNGFVSVDLVLILSTPETDPLKGFARLNAEAVHLFRALDGHPQLLWETAERGVLNSGESIYIVPISLITSYQE